MKPRTSFGFHLGGACAEGVSAVAPQCRPGARGAWVLEVLRETGDPRPWSLKRGILARAGQVDPSIPGY